MYVALKRRRTPAELRAITISDSEPKKLPSTWPDLCRTFAPQLQTAGDKIVIQREKSGNYTVFLI
jgi:hypothetical protein